MLALALVALVVSQAEAPAVCLQPRTRDSIEALQKRLLPTQSQLRVFLTSERKDIPDDRTAATDLLSIAGDLFDITAHFYDLANIGDLSTDKETKHRVRRRMVTILESVRQTIDTVKKALTHYSPYVTLPLLANEMKELRSTVGALEEGLADCMKGTKLLSAE